MLDTLSEALVSFAIGVVNLSRPVLSASWTSYPSLSFMSGCAW